MKLTHPILLLSLLSAYTAASGQVFELKRLGAYAHGSYDESAAEIVAYDAGTKRLFVVNGDKKSIDVLSAADPTKPSLLFRLSPGGGPNSVAVRGGIVAVAVEGAPKTSAGRAVFYNATVAEGAQPAASVEVGALPDMITFTPDGKYVLTANEGEPNSDYSIDPEGSVSVIDISGGLSRLTQDDVRTAGFKQFNTAILDPSVRVYGIKSGNVRSTPAEDFEPEYIAVSADSRTGWVTLQEANAIGILDIPSATFTRIIGLGFKDHNLAGNGFDASDQNSGKIGIKNWPVFGMYQPDAIASFEHAGKTYFITANEGDAREYNSANDELRRVGSSSLNLDAGAFPNAAALKNNSNLGRLHVTTKNGDTDNDGDFDKLYSLGGRSFSIWDANGVQVYDSGDQMEQYFAANAPANFNASNTNNTKKNRSDDKGPEPEGVVVGTVGPQRIAFVALERMSGIMAYDISDPVAPKFLTYTSSRDFSATPALNSGGDLGPEGLALISASDSPNGKPMLAVGNEISGTTTLYEIRSAGDVTSGLTISFAGFSVNRAANTVTGAVTLTNTGSSPVSGPLYLTIPGVTMKNKTGDVGSTAYIAVPATSIRPGSTERVNVEFTLPNASISDPNQVLGTLRPRILSGSL